ncbi:sporulation-specific N-acetylmuramoyl-L-alanine amidase [Halolactibacillus alkaliphilus]|uniref:Sporulation-specific N-acetylmuramoyl-L-alanine amidase n=1 Tax=Halolactibacillus alkaliphilus TaxID=442899 RepID=A0A511X002_9BACI|nr:N-acetylmuramoyl-L-alanine amidase [Halolactibacillus alkaliphilus]GEN56272.1 sporulation-specific N-acetylmuramoyl-L-alanine amidase [Halolactibacillus alkaliphilus]GGN66263.1 sporulation-specific N-acetylmuramoyl-L-alanine amidase [Halolactibacillus alkaliphilus]SFO67393.1 N-acetylmuramoyl-L-alanine amidase [Halolactibacillus alkaliphilus]
MRIFIDPGHGGHDPGAVYKNLKEKDLTLAIAKRISAQLYHHPKIVLSLSRSVDETVSLHQRVEKAHAFKADLFISIHINAGGGTGFESYRYLHTREKTKGYHERVHQSIIAELKVRDRGIKKGDFYVLRNTRMPAVLTESYFIDHPNDYAMLQKQQTINSIATAHVKGITSLLDKKTTPSSVICGSFKNRDKAEKRQALLKSHGFETTLTLMTMGMNRYYRVNVHSALTCAQVQARLRLLGLASFSVKNN